MIENLEKTINKSFRMEMIGAGLYKGLAKQYQSQDSSLSRTFLKFSNQEAMHGVLFQNYSMNKFNKRFKSGFFWKFLGRFVASLMRFTPLEKILKKLQTAEQDAVNRIEETLNMDLDDEYRKIMDTILPHEKAHAALYSKVCEDNKNNG